jgi:RHS repeat-associated protein
VGAWGVRWDDGVGLHYMRQRWYDASSGRFVTRDPLADVFDDYKQGFPPKNEVYLYGRNNPSLNIDPEGLQANGYNPVDPATYLSA